MEEQLILKVSKAIRDAYYNSEESEFGNKEAKAAIIATVEWLKEREEQDSLSFLFPTIDLLDEELKK